jgi:hypothetical protein
VQEETNAMIFDKLNTTGEAVMSAMEEGGFMKNNLRDSIAHALSFSVLKPLDPAINLNKATDILRGASFSAIKQLDDLWKEDERVSDQEIDTTFLVCLLTYD